MQATLLFVVCLSAGCETRIDPQLAAHRAEILLTQQPAQATSIEDARKQLADSAVVTIKGQADLEAFQSTGGKKALMLVREILPNDHGHPGHDPSSCPFCKRRMEAAAKAAVEFVDDNGKVLPYPVDELFELKQGDQVVVKGTAELDEGLDIMKITASGLHVTARDQH